LFSFDLYELILPTWCVWNKGATKSILSEKGDGKVIYHDFIYWAWKYSPWCETV